MNANPVLLQKKYARIVKSFADEAGIILDDALAFFYKSMTYTLMSEGISNMHCMSDLYLTGELMAEYNKQFSKNK